jgi:ribonucleoside-diphosphate reductase alpha chain
MTIATSRQRLPDRRENQTFTLECAGLKFTATVSHYPDGRLGEVFLVNHKAGSSAGIMASDAAITASLALQFGSPAEVLRKALSRDARGNATSPLGIALDLFGEWGAP